MKRSQRTAPNDPTVVTIGTFDGVHLGHRWLVRQVTDRAKELQVRSCVVTFEPIPISVLRPEKYRGRICTPEQKLVLLKATGIDQVSVIPFTRELAALSPETFLASLVEDCGMAELWVGNDFALGKNRIGTVDRIAEIGVDLGFTTHPLERRSDNAQHISSSRIREAIETGDMALAARLLGRPFQVSGVIIHGTHLGRTIGFPTANFIPPPGIVRLPDGIYASIARVAGSDNRYPSMTYAGNRPTVAGTDRQIETHIFDFSEDLYDQELRVEIVEKIRDDQHFDGLDALVAQLKDDEALSREILDRFQDEPNPKIESVISS